MNQVEYLDIVKISLLKLWECFLEVSVYFRLRLPNESERSNEVSGIDHLVDLMQNLR